MSLFSFVQGAYFPSPNENAEKYDVIKTSNIQNPDQSSALETFQGKVIKQASTRHEFKVFAPSLNDMMGTSESDSVKVIRACTCSRSEQSRFSSNETDRFKPSNGEIMSILIPGIFTWKIMTTSAACIAGGVMTYPAEMYRLSFTTKELAAWSFDKYESHSPKGNALVEEISKYFEERQKVRMILSPLFRLISHEVALSATAGMMSNTTLMNSNNDFSSTYNSDGSGSSILLHEIIAGAFAGTSQALLLCPLEAWRANEVRRVEEEKQKSWKHWVKWTRSQFFGGGSSDPMERQIRVHRGVGVLAAREMIFNISFFPMFNGIRRYLNDTSHVRDLFASTKSISLTASNVEAINTFTSGILAGVACSLVVTPMDVVKTYYMHSREKWSVWSGTRVFAPPLQLLTRGLTLQAFVFGPTFGIVASIYELT